MTPDEQETALREESPRVEWKESDRKPEEILKAVAALANDLEASGQPGFVVLGLRNDGTACGLGYTGSARDQAQLALANRISSVKLLPTPSFSIATLDRDGAFLLLVRVTPYAVPPIVKVDGVPWVRVGTQTRRATDADVARLQERRPESAQSFDARIMPGAALDDLNLITLRAEHAVARGDGEDEPTFPDLERWLAQRELVRRADGAWRPTTAAILLYGLSPQSFVPGAVVELARYDGVDFADPIALRKAAEGTLRDQLEAVWFQTGALIANVPAGQDGIRTPYVPEYPVEALKELVLNMIQHRRYDATNAPARIAWFDDRIVFTNPGGPFGQASQGTFGEFSDYRNPSVTRGLVDLGYVERLGRGVRKVRRLLEKAGHPPLEVETDGFTTLTVRKRA